MVPFLVALSRFQRFEGSGINEKNGQDVGDGDANRDLGGADLVCIIVKAPGCRTRKTIAAMSQQHAPRRKLQDVLFIHDGIYSFCFRNPPF